MRRAVWRIAGAALLTLLSGVGLAAQTRSIDPYTLPVVQAACGAEGGSPPQAISDSHVANTPLKAGMARVYVITETRGFFGSRGEPVLLGMDGGWFGANRSYVYGYSFVDVNPGVHHLCIAATVKGVLPHTSAGVLLARVDAAAGKMYFFYNQCIQLARVFSLRTMSAEDGAMYLQALPSSKIPKLWKTAAAQAACGVDPSRMPSDPVPPPALPGPPAEGQALIYFFSGVPQFGSHGVPIHVGVDGNWVGETQMKSYVGVQMAPGVHRLCSATKIMLGMKPTLHLGQLNLVAGKTYFVDTNTLQPVEHSLATVWLRRIAAMPKSDTPDRKSLKQWSRTNFPASPDELSACGIPASDSTAVAPTMVQPVNGPVPESQVIFVLQSDIKRLHRRHAVDVGLDGRWVASLQSTSLVALPVATGRHELCVRIRNGTKRRDRWFSPDSTLILDSATATDATSLYFESHVIVISLEYGDIYLFESNRLDPDEGALLLAYYPRADTLHP